MGGLPFFCADETDNDGMNSALRNPWRSLWILLLCLGAQACSPSMNWREVQVEDASLSLMLPCKPDRAMRPVTLAGVQVDLGMVGCDVGEATFTLAYARLPQGVSLSDALAQWQSATLSRLQAAQPQAQPYVPAGALAVPQSLRMTLSGHRPDGSTLQAQMSWFARSSDRGVEMFQAAVYGPRLSSEPLETLLGSLRFL